MFIPISFIDGLLFTMQAHIPETQAHERLVPPAVVQPPREETNMLAPYEREPQKLTSGTPLCPSVRVFMPSIWS